MAHDFNPNNPGSIPVDLCKLKDVMELTLNNNKLTGESLLPACHADVLDICGGPRPTVAMLGVATPR